VSEILGEGHGIVEPDDAELFRAEAAELRAERAEAGRQRKAEEAVRMTHWLAEIDHRPLWTLVETLFWIAFRVHERAAPFVDAAAYIQRQYITSGVLMGATGPGLQYWRGVAESEAARETGFEPAPFRLLRQAAQREKGLARGFLIGAPERSEIPADAWDALTLEDGDGGVVARAPGGAQWHGVLFARETLVRAFSPAGDQPESAPADWRNISPNTLKSWSTNPAVESEAESRVKATGARLTETGKARAMEAMASEVGARWGSESIAVTRRRAR
jgi:hypothetical protein